jgi:magnesium chelatase family protein
VTLARTWSVALVGVVGHMVEVEADLAQGLPGLTLVGLPDAALSESRDRIRSALVNSGEPWPGRRITLNLSPASLPKSGSGFDLALAVGVLAAAGRLDADRVSRLVLIGELGLDGGVRRVRGLLPSVAASVRAGYSTVVVPRAGTSEASLVPGVDVVAVGSLTELIAILRGEPHVVGECGPLQPDAECFGTSKEPCPDLVDVAGQLEGRYAIEIAAAGGHHLLFHGPPGAGKTMLAERLPSILPVLEPDEALEVTAIHSVAGQLPTHDALIRIPPFRAPHHSASIAAVVGGGSGLARPGAATLAHHGVLFLDETTEC